MNGAPPRLHAQGRLPTRALEQSRAVRTRNPQYRNTHLDCQGSTAQISRSVVDDNQPSSACLDCVLGFFGKAQGSTPYHCNLAGHICGPEFLERSHTRHRHQRRAEVSPARAVQSTAFEHLVSYF